MTGSASFDSVRQTALDSLLRSVQQDVGRFIGNLMSHSADVPDVLQEVFLTVVRKLGTLRDPTLFRPWIFRVASREAFKALRADREWTALVGKGPLDEDVTAAAPTEAALAEWIDISAMIANLSLASRTVIALHYLQGLTHDEIATALGISAGTVKSRLAYGLTQLRRRAG